MDALVLPLRAIAFQLLLLLVAIAIESFFLQSRLGLSRRICVEYSATANLISTVLGWLLFFYIEWVVPSDLKQALINFVLFNRWEVETLIWLIVIGTVTFFSTLALKIKSFELVDVLQTIKVDEESRDRSSFDKADFQPVSLSIRAMGTKSLAILQAHSYSHIAILLLLITHLLKNRL